MRRLFGSAFDVNGRRSCTDLRKHLPQDAEDISSRGRVQVTYTFFESLLVHRPNLIQGNLA